MSRCVLNLDIYLSKQKVYSVALDLVDDYLYFVAQREPCSAAGYAHALCIEVRRGREIVHANKPFGGVFQFDEKSELGNRTYRAGIRLADMMRHVFGFFVVVHLALAVLRHTLGFGTFARRVANEVAVLTHRLCPPRRYALIMR